jgi:hypothetical protein
MLAVLRRPRLRVFAMTLGVFVFVFGTVLFAHARPLAEGTRNAGDGPRVLTGEE